MELASVVGILQKVEYDSTLEAGLPNPFLQEETMFRLTISGQQHRNLSA